MSGSDALERLAAELRDERTVVSPHVEPPSGAPVFGDFVAAGPRAEPSREDYALLTEAIREGYLLHYGKPRIARIEDADLALLAGDYLYARGLERLATLGDLEAVRELADLIALSARVHVDGQGEAAEASADALWLATATAVGCGGGVAHERAKSELRAGAKEAATALALAARDRAAAAGLDDEFALLAHSIGFPAPERSASLDLAEAKRGN